MTIKTYLKSGDTLPELNAQLIDARGCPISLVGASVLFVMADADGHIVINSPATIVNEETGQVRYSWQAGDTTAVGTYDAEFIAMYGAKRMTVPTREHLTVEIEAALL